jgi:hypothetical protein
MELSHRDIDKIFSLVKTDTTKRGKSSTKINPKNITTTATVIGFFKTSATRP